jgi:glucan-binding YG repeat protein
MAHFKRIVAAGLTLTTVATLLPMTTLAAHYGEWVEKDGKMYYYDYNGKKVKYRSEQRYDSESGTYKYYVLNSKGAQVTAKGWFTTNYYYTNYYNKIKIKNKYYIKSDGSVTTGWKKISKKWYYFYDDGTMAKNIAIEQVDESTGKSKYYLVGNDGKRITKKGWHQVKYTYFDTDYGDKFTYKVWYYVKSDGSVYVNCVKKIKGKKYLFSREGALVQNDYCGLYNAKTGETTYYSADKNGVLYTKKGIRTIKYSESYTYCGYYKEKYTANYKVYVKSDGTLYRGLKKVKDKYYYFNITAYRCTSTTVDGTKYYFGRSGASTRIVKLNYT